MFHRSWCFSPVNFTANRSISGEHLLKQGFLRERLGACRSLYRRDLFGHYGCVNAIEFSNHGGDKLISGGDDRRVLLWRLDQALHDQGQPAEMKGHHISNIFCLAFSSDNSRIFSAGNDEQVILHDTNSRETKDVFRHEDAVYGLSVDPNNDNVFASACDDGRVLIWDIRENPTADPFCLANYTSAFHAVVYNPVEPRLLATANSKEGIALWDIRKPRSCVLRFGSSLSSDSAMSVKFNALGTQLVGLRRRLPPVLYNLHSSAAACQFDHPGYYNSCTMKSCCFAGDRDQYLLSGSDDFNLYLWRIPEDTELEPQVAHAHMVLKGHRSIVNQVRFNPATHLVVSSGVEKVIKVWSPFQQPECGGQIDHQDSTPQRSMYSHEEYISLVLNSGQGLSHDYGHQSVQEDPRMIAFFDSLVQREIEGWSSESEDSLDLDEGIFRPLQELAEIDSDSAARATAQGQVLGTRSPRDRQSDTNSTEPLLYTDSRTGENADERPLHPKSREFLSTDSDSDSDEQTGPAAEQQQAARNSSSLPRRLRVLMWGDGDRGEGGASGSRRGSSPAPDTRGVAAAPGGRRRGLSDGTRRRGDASAAGGRRRVRSAIAASSLAVQHEQSDSDSDSDRRARAMRQRNAMRAARRAHDASQPHNSSAPANQAAGNSSQSAEDSARIRRPSNPKANAEATSTGERFVPYSDSDSSEDEVVKKLGSMEKSGSQLSTSGPSSEAVPSLQGEESTMAGESVSNAGEENVAISAITQEERVVQDAVEDAGPVVAPGGDAGPSGDAGNGDGQQREEHRRVNGKTIVIRHDPEETGEAMLERLQNLVEQYNQVVERHNQWRQALRQAQGGDTPAQQAGGSGEGGAPGGEPAESSLTEGDGGVRQVENQDRSVSQQAGVEAAVQINSDENTAHSSQGAAEGAQFTSVGMTQGTESSAAATVSHAAGQSNRPTEEHIGRPHGHHRVVGEDNRDLKNGDLANGSGVEHGQLMDSSSVEKRQTGMLPAVADHSYGMDSARKRSHKELLGSVTETPQYDGVTDAKRGKLSAEPDRLPVVHSYQHDFTHPDHGRGLPRGSELQLSAGKDALPSSSSNGTFSLSAGDSAATNFPAANSVGSVDRTETEWNNFKRFKNRLERARNRDHGHHVDSDSDDDL